jgi:hypothetical protein
MNCVSAVEEIVAEELDYAGVTPAGFGNLQSLSVTEPDTGGIGVRTPTGDHSETARRGSMQKES